MNDVMDQIIESLAFEIEAVPNEYEGPKSTGLSDPINIKIRIRNKDQNKILRQGVISIPKKEDPTYSSGRIQLSSSDQTIMSFDVLMKEDESKKKQMRKQKRKFRFFKKGACLGNQTDEEYYESQKKVSMDNDQLVPIKSTSINDINKRNFTLTKNYGNSDTGRLAKHKDILGQCKPGGCLDPPYGEDKYYYVPKLIQISKSQRNSTKLKTNDIEYQKSLKQNTNLDDKDKIANKNNVLKNKEKSSFSTNINLLNTKYSNSIITYPSISSHELGNQDNIQKTVQYNKNNNESSKPSNEIVETYFTSPKKIKNNKFQGDSNSSSRVDAEKLSFEKIPSQGQKEMNESKPEMLKNAEDTFDTEGSIFESKMKYQSNNENFEKVDTNLKTQISSLIDLINSHEVPLINNEINKKDSLNNTILGVISDTEALKVFSNQVTVSSTPPRTIYKINSDITVLNTKTSAENKKDNKLAIDRTFNLETFTHDSSFLQAKLDNEIETCHEEGNNCEANIDVLEPSYFNKSEEIKLINEFVDNERHSNESFIRQNENTKEITNIDTGFITPNTLFKRNSNNISILNIEVLPQKNNITTLNQDLQTPLTNTKLTSKSDFSNEHVESSSSFNQKDNGPDIVHIHEQRLLDSEINSNLLSTNNINNSEHNSKISNEFNEMTAFSLNTSNVDDDVYTNFKPLTQIKENSDQVLISNDSNLQISVKIESENFMSYDTEPNEIKSVKSYTQKSGLVIDFKETELLKQVQSSPLVTLSLTSIERDLHRLDNLVNIPSAESKDLDSRSNFDTNSKDNEVVETFSVKNLEREDSRTKENNSDSNLSLSINKHVKTPVLEEIVSDKGEIHIDVSIDDTKKLQENEIKINSNTMLSINKVNLQNSKDTLHDENLNNGIRKSDIVNSSSEMGFKVSRVLSNLENNVNSSKNDQFNSSHKTIVSQVENDTNKKDKHNFIRTFSKTDLSRDNNLKDTVYLDMAFQSFYTAIEGNVIRTVETSNNDIKRYENDNILHFMTLARFDDSPITIPIDRDKKLLLKILKTQEKENRIKEIKKDESVSSKHDQKHKLVVSDKGLKKYTTINTNSEGSLQRTLDNVYNEKLLPLHNIIKDLKSDIDGLLKQQLLIKDKLHNEKGLQLHQISKNNKTCFCVEHLLMKH